MFSDGLCMRICFNIMFNVDIIKILKWSHLVEYLSSSPLKFKILRLSTFTLIVDKAYILIMCQEYHICYCNMLHGSSMVSKISSAVN